MRISYGPRVRLSVCLSHAGIHLKLMTVYDHASFTFWFHTESSLYTIFRTLDPRGTLFARASNETVVGKNGKNSRFVLSINRYISEVIEDRQTATMED